MTRFVFKLDPLLKARVREEEVAQRRVAEIERTRLELEGRLRRMQEGIAREKGALREQLRGVLAIGALRLEAHAALDLVRAANEVVLQLAGVHRRLDAAREVLIEATRRRRALELLRERRYAIYKAAMEKAETDFLDELAVTRARKEPLR